MIRTIESIQKDIADTICGIQQLRRTQGPARNDDLAATTRRIHELTIRLDALYMEKRAVNSPAPVTSGKPSEQRRPSRQPGQAAQDLIAQLFAEAS